MHGHGQVGEDDARKMMLNLLFSAAQTVARFHENANVCLNKRHA